MSFKAHRALPIDSLICRMANVGHLIIRRILLSKIEISLPLIHDAMQELGIETG